MIENNTTKENKAAKCVIVTGAAKGIGRAVTENLLAKSYSLVLVDLDGEPIREIAAQNSSRVKIVEGSVADFETAQQAAAAAQELGGAVGLSHNAGIQRYGTAEDTSLELWDEVMSANLRGAFLMAKTALPQLIQNQGSVVLMASVQGLATQNNVAAYTCSKHAVIGLAKSIAVDFARFGVRANAVAPGSVQTPMLDWAISLADDPAAVRKEIRDMHPIGRAAEASQIASVVSFLLSKEASFITGETLRVDGGLLSRIPGAPQKADQ